MSSPLSLQQYLENSDEKISFPFRKEKGRFAALINPKDRIYFSTSTSLGSTWLSFSPAQALIHHVYEKERFQARKVIRNPIFFNDSPNPVEQAWIKVAAKRWGRLAEIHPRFSSISLPWEIVESDLIPQANDETFWNQMTFPRQFESLEAATQWLESTTVTLGGDASFLSLGLPIVAILLSNSFEVLSYGFNLSRPNRTLHAEVNLLRRYWHRFSGSPIPSGSILYTSLKPCRMCSALIWQARQFTPDLQVRWLHDDGGRYARHTLIDQAAAPPEF